MTIEQEKTFPLPVEFCFDDILVELLVVVGVQEVFHKDLLDVPSTFQDAGSKVLVRGEDD